jgi:hypothetical protein
MRDRISGINGDKSVSFRNISKENYNAVIKPSSYHYS